MTERKELLWWVALIVACMVLLLVAALASGQEPSLYPDPIVLRPVNGQWWVERPYRYPPAVRLWRPPLKLEVEVKVAKGLDFLIPEPPPRRTVVVVAPPRRPAAGTNMPPSPLPCSWDWWVEVFYGTKEDTGKCP